VSSHPRDELVDLDHLVRLADQTLEAVARPELLAVLEILAGEPARVEGAPHDDLDLLHPEWLGEVVERARVDGFDRRLDRGEGRQDDNRQVGLNHRQLLEDGQPIEIGHAQVDQRHVERLGGGQPQRLFAAAGDSHAIALAAERLGQELARDLIVVHDQEHRRGGGHP